jgi:hypothetical protein
MPDVVTYEHLRLWEKALPCKKEHISMWALCVITPAALGPQYFREVADASNAGAGGPPDRAKMEEIMRRHGLTPALPQG